YDLPQRIRFDASFADRVSGAGGLDLDLTSQSDLDATDAAKAPPRGQLIAIEGIDGAGKTTIRYALYEALWADRQPSFIVGQRGWLDPVDTRTIVDFREQRADHDPEIVRAARFRDKVSLITRSVAPALRTHHVIADRYVISDAVYEEALLGVPAEVTLDRHRSGGTRSPDLTIFLDPDPMVALGRVGRRTRDLQVHENAEDLRRISNVYRRVFDDPQYAPPSQLLRFSRELPENPAQAAALVVEKVRERLAI
ncbi:MAG: hypothetical protein IOD05_15530, partial [Rhodobacter sp.]|nr:hypothetical protein [Rhodobacter sp.]